MQRYLLFDSGCSRCRNLAAVVRRPILALGILFVVANVVTTYGLHSPWVPSPDRAGNRATPWR